MKRSLTFLVALSLMAGPPVFAQTADTSQAESAMEEPEFFNEPPPFPGQIILPNTITHEAVDRFIASLAGKKVKRITITSSGGDAEAGLKFGKWIRENNLDVRVRIICMSACANFVFTAAKNKYIDKGALIIWHGSLEQKDIREEAAYYNQLKGRQAIDPAELSARELQYLADNRKKFETLNRLRPIQADFYAQVGVDEYITRLGQEPKAYPVDGWTATIELMNHMGIRNVFADADYASPKYIKRNPAAWIASKGQPVVFGLNESGEIVALNEPAAGFQQFGTPQTPK